MSFLCRSVWLLSFLFPLVAGTARADATQWRAWEATFEAKAPLADPASLELDVAFTGPGGQNYSVPAFWDGGTTWKIRFAPTVPGNWSYLTACPADEPLRIVGLHCEAGALSAQGAQGDNPLFRHGGLLRVSQNGRYLTYSDGTPFFWLGDTWVYCPSNWCPIDGSSNAGIPSMFRALIDTRRDQRFTVVEMLLTGPGGAVELISRGRAWTPEWFAYWRNMDRYVAYANDAGILLAIGIGHISDLDDVPLDDLRRAWRYVIGRYGADAITWLLVGEYNQDNWPGRVDKMLMLGRYVKAIDPYKRAMTVHPWYYAGDRRQAWAETWLDFIMLQAGHGDGMAPTQVYWEAYSRAPTRPILEAEAVFERIRGLATDRTRMAAYRAIQSGSFGYTYGAHGLWYPAQNAADQRQREWGPMRPWWEAMQYPGADQMRVLRGIYESLDWWKLEPVGAAFTAARTSEERQVLVKSDGSSTFVIYVPAGVPSDAKLLLRRADCSARYAGTWMDPRTGAARPAADVEWVDRSNMLLPPVPDANDWVLVLKKQDGPAAICPGSGAVTTTPVAPAATPGTDTGAAIRPAMDAVKP